MTHNPSTSGPDQTKERHEFSIACVDRSPQICSRIRSIFADLQVHLVFENNLDRILERFEQRHFDVLILSSDALKSGEAEAMEGLEIISAKSPGTQILFLVRPKHIEMARFALTAGSHQYSKLPLGDEELRLLIETALAQQPAHAPNLLLKPRHHKATLERMVGGSPSMIEIYRQIRQAASTDIPVLLTGETGSGKDLAAEAIHNLSSRREALYLPVHLGALPQDLVSSELFGHEKGAFTNALARQKGAFEQASKGTVFLDEVSTMNDKVQVSLLRLLENMEFYRIGGWDSIQADVRIIAATNEDLYDLVARGLFREDLFYRLEVFHIVLPSLRQRNGDIPLLIDHFLGQYNEAFDKTIRGISPECVARLESYDWPGNVRELKNVIQRAVVMCSGEVLLPEHLPARITRGGPGRPRISFPVGTTLSEVEKEMLARTLSFTGNNRSRAAAMLGISRRSIYNKIEKYGL